MSQSLATTNGHLPANTLTLAMCEGEMSAAIDDMRRAWARFGRAVGHVHTGKLWRDGFDSFDAYIDEYVYPTLGIPRSTCYEWMQAAGVIAEIESYSVAYRVIDPPAHINHALELSRLPEGEKAPALIEARKLAGDRGKSEATLYEVQRVVMARLGEPVPLSPADTQHNRYQTAIAAHIRRQWLCLDPDRRTALLAELTAGIEPEDE